MFALQQSYKTVPLEMRSRIMNRDCTSISEAVDAVERYEELLNDCSDKKRAAACGISTRVMIKIKAEHTDNKRTCNGRDHHHNNVRNNQSTESTVRQYEHLSIYAENAEERKPYQSRRN